MRGVIFIVGVLAGLLSMALPAAAHKGSHPALVHGAAKAMSIPVMAKCPPLAVGACAGAKVVAAPLAHEPERRDHGRDEAAHLGLDLHNANDHSHPIGEDTYHQKAAHSSLDFGFLPATVPFSIATSVSFQLMIFNETARGISVSPPVPPPLG